MHYLAAMASRSFARISFVVVACCAVCSGLVAKKKPPTAPINLNNATSEELQLVPGIGPVTAEKILQMRKSYGAFKSVDDLSAIRGIGPKRLEKMRKYLTVGKATTPPASATKPTIPSKPATPPKPSTVPGGGRVHRCSLWRAQGLEQKPDSSLGSERQFLWAPALLPRVSSDTPLRALGERASGKRIRGPGG